MPADEQRVPVSLESHHSRSARLTAARYQRAGPVVFDDQVACAGKVLARNGNGDLVFVGRSLRPRR